MKRKRICHNYPKKKTEFVITILLYKINGKNTVLKRNTVVNRHFLIYVVFDLTMLSVHSEPVLNYSLSDLRFKRTQLFFFFLINL